MADTEVPPENGPRALGESFAALIGDQTWQLDAPEQLENVSPTELLASPLAAVSGTTDVPARRAAEHESAASPPTPVRIIEALLFAGGPPLQPEQACEVVRGLSPEQFRECVDALNARYRVQGRPYAIIGGEQGFTLIVRSRWRSVRERLFGGPREARLSQPALDVLALVAYRQPTTRTEVDNLRGADSGALLRQLVRLGLIAVTQRGEAEQREVAYGTTPRFLDVFGLRSLDDLPQTGDTQRL